MCLHVRDECCHLALVMSSGARVVVALNRQMELWYPIITCTPVTPHPNEKNGYDIHLCPIWYWVRCAYCSTPPGGVKMLRLYFWATLMFIFIHSQLLERPGCQTDLKFLKKRNQTKGFFFFRHDTPSPASTWATMRQFRCSSTLCHSQRAFLFSGEAPRLICLVLLYSTVCGRAACPLVWPLRHKDRKAWFVISLVQWRRLSFALSAVGKLTCWAMWNITERLCSVWLMTFPICIQQFVQLWTSSPDYWTRLVIAFSIFFHFILTSN